MYRFKYPKKRLWRKNVSNVYQFVKQSFSHTLWLLQKFDLDFNILVHQPLNCVWGIFTCINQLGWHSYLYLSAPRVTIRWPDTTRNCPESSVPGRHLFRVLKEYLYAGTRLALLWKALPSYKFAMDP